MPCDDDRSDNESCDNDDFDEIIIDGYETEDTIDLTSIIKENDVVTNARAIKKANKKPEKQRCNPSNV